MTAYRASLTGLLATASLLAFASSAAAQDQPPTTQAGLEEIVVTAQKREESLQDTPLAISAVTSETIEARGIAEADDISSLAPNVVAAQTPSGTSNLSLFIRAIGTSEPILTNDAPVSTYLDGIVIGRITGALFDLVDLERIEVLRGPQGTLYGRNTTGGAVNFITAKPGDEAGADIMLSYGTFDLMMGRVSLDTGELGDSGLSAKLSYVHKQRDGYIDDLNQPDRNDPGAYNVDAARLALRFDRNNGLRVNYAFDYNDRDSWAVPFQLAAVSPLVGAYLALSPVLGGATPVIERERLDTLRLDMGEIHDEVQGHALTIEAELGENLMLRSLSGYRQWENDQTNGDLDGNSGLVGFLISPAILAPPPFQQFIPLGVGPINLFSADNRRRQDQISQEFNLIGSLGESFDFVLGAFYFTEEATEDNPQFLTLILPIPVPLGPGLTTPAVGVNIATGPDYEHDSSSRAVFGQATWRPTEKLSLTGGVRHTRDTKHLFQTAPQSRDLERSFNRITWSASADYQWTEDFMTYARVATGYKAGGFNARSVNAGYGPEKIISYELGLKSELLDNRLRFNGAVFYAKYDDLQVQQFLAGSGGAASITVNAGKATYKGIELEATAVPVDGLTLSGSFGYVDREYDEFLILDPATNMIIDISDEAKFGYSASTTGNASAEYVLPALELGRLSARVDYSYRSRVFYHISASAGTPFNDFIADDPVHLIDARVTLGDIRVGGGEASLSIWGRNLTDSDYLNAGIDFGSLGFAGVSYAEGRTWGVDLKLEF